MSTKLVDADHKVLRGILLTVVFLFGAKLLGAAKEAVVAYNYGTSLPVDAYALGFSLLNWPVSLASMCANMLLIPAYVAAASGRVRSPQTLQLLLHVFVAGLALAALCWLVMRNATTWLNVNADTGAALAKQAMALSFALPAALCATVLAAGMLASHRQIASLLEAIPAVAVGLAVALVGAIAPPDTVLAWSTCFGFWAYLATLIALNANKLRPPTLAVAAGNQDSFARHHVLLALVAQAVFLFGGVALDQVVIGQATDAQNAALSYSNRLLMLVAGLGATAMGRAFFPVLSAAASRAEANMLLSRWLLITSVTSLLAVAALWFGGYTLVRIVFLRGDFNDDDAALVGRLLQLGALQLPFYFCGMLLAQWAAVNKRFWSLITSNAIGVATKIAMLFGTSSIVSGETLMYSSLAMYAATSLMLLTAWRYERLKKD